MKFKNLKLNIIVTIISQVLTIIFAFIVPKLYIYYYGTDIHGLLSVMGGLITYLTLVEAGLGAASIQNLYKPLQEKNYTLINADLNAISIFYNRIGFIFSSFVIITAIIYPMIVSRGLSNYVIMILILITGLSQSLEYFFCSKYKILLQADKKLYAINIINAVGTLIQGVLRIVLIVMNFNIFIVQLIPSFIYLIRLILIKIYVKRKYNYLDTGIKPNMSVTKKRWNVLIHQISNLVVNNTDSIVLSIFVNYSVVSVYSIYNMIMSNINGFLNQSLSNSITANFGHLLNEKNDKLIVYYDYYEKIYYYIITIIFSVCSFLLLPFVKLYTKGLNYNYFDRNIALLFIINAILCNIRIPHLTLVNAYGRYKETQNHAILEAIMNIVISITLVQYMGIYGVLIGTMTSYLIRDFLFVLYVNKQILKRSMLKSVMNIIQMIFLLLVIYIICCFLINVNKIATWFDWVIVGVISMTISIMVCLASILLFEKKIRTNLLYKVKKFKVNK